MKRRKFTKTNIEKIPHPENGKREAKYFDFNKKKFSSLLISKISH